MKKFKSTFLTLVFLSLIIGSCFAQGNKEDAATLEDKISLKVLNYYDTTEPGYEKERQIWQNFRDNNPDIELITEDLCNEAFHQKVSAYIASGNLPDVMYMYPSGRSEALHKNKLVKDLAPLLGEEFLSNFVSTTLDVKTQSSGYLAELPQSICYSTVVYTNKGLLDSLNLEVPKTYEELKALVPILRAHGIQTVLMANKDDWVMQSCLFSTIAGRYVGTKWFDDVKAGKVKFTDPEFVNALKMLETMYNDNVISRNTIQIAYGEAPGLFASGKAAFYIDGDWKQSAFLTNETTGEALIPPEKQKNELELIALPALPGEKFPGVVSATLGCGFGISSAIPDGSEKEKAAVKLIKYLYSTEVQQQYLDIGRYVPSRKDVSADNVEPIIKKMMKYYSQSNSTCYVLDSALDPSVYTVLNKVLQEIGMGVKTPNQAAIEIQNAMNTFLNNK